MERLSATAAEKVLAATLASHRGDTELTRDAKGRIVIVCHGDHIQVIGYDRFVLIGDAIARAIVALSNGLLQAVRRVAAVRRHRAGDMEAS